jgi:beta-N-acetylhexosaminidase
MRPIIPFLLFFYSSLFGASLDEKLGEMLIFGMQGTTLNDSRELRDAVASHRLGGVILFGKNMQSKKQVLALTASLQKLGGGRLLIAVDQEGGRVDRLGRMHAFAKTPSATQMEHRKKEEAAQLYTRMAHNLKSLGINLNFAPVVDLCQNPKNRVIVKNGRCFSKDPKRVVEMARCFIDAHRKAGVLCTLKHFPGHGSSMGDSHQGFTDVTKTWRREELIPFAKLISEGYADAIMSAHIYNSDIDPLFPATLSKKTVQGLLRTELGFDGVVISDDMQMGAIRENYTLEESIERAIAAGCDMLLFGNQLAKPLKVSQVLHIMKRLYKEGRITDQQIERANSHIAALKEKIKG